ncbi:TetR/AcrR family transcriptional regulator [Nocardioides daejeonensis]|uniref:TetR/AcrR family transcriptional regulator n=1 Tax=Nocardioides daejeonensis TaxID=1046556 RepID=UPI000D74F5AB|nr:TetR/AcrR family transcriptional regulator [Nocardioides daejeonensis]
MTRTPTRTRLLDAARKAFATRGYDAVTVIELEEAVGLSPGSGSFYRHFRSKEDVLAAVVDRELARTAERNAARERRAEGSLATTYADLLAALDDLRYLMAMLVRDGDRLPIDRVRAALAETGIAVDAAHLRSLMEAGSIPARDPEAVASVVLHALVGYHLAEQFFRSPVGVDRGRFTLTLADLVAR